MGMETLQEEKLENASKSKEIRRLNKNLNGRNEQIMSLKNKLDHNVHHITTEYIINQQKQQIIDLKEELQSVQLQLNKCKLEMAENCDQHKNFENVYDALYFLLNVVRSRYDG